jgi:8-amino-7-oxononanoate synthase
MQGIRVFREKIIAGIEKYGTLFPSSRISNTRLQLYETFERNLSALHQTQNTVTYSSGYLACQAASGLLFTDEPIFIAPATHPSVMSGCRSNGIIINEWTDISRQINEAGVNHCSLIADMINIMQSRVNNFDLLKDIKPNVQVRVLIDNSHGGGLVGPNGMQFIRELPIIDNVEYIFCYSLSKAYHINGGAVSCSSELANQLRKEASYSGSTAISPSNVFAFMESEELYEQQRSSLARNVDQLSKLTNGFSIISNDPRLPIFIINSPFAEEYFFEESIVISSFNYPSPDSEKVNRVIISALHTDEDIRKIAQCIEELLARA